MVPLQNHINIQNYIHEQGIIQIHAFVQDRSNPSVLAMELL